MVVSFLNVGGLLIVDSLKDFSVPFACNESFTVASPCQTQTAFIGHLLSDNKASKQI